MIPIGSIMRLKVEKSAATGFCSGVKRAIEILEKTARERGQVETLGAVVHNQQVLKRLADIGVRVADSINDIQGDVVVTGAHGVSPQVMEELKSRFSEVINSTSCPFVHRAWNHPKRQTYLLEKSTASRGTGGQNQGVRL